MDPRDHSTRHVVIAGAGVAGLVSALILGRAGHRVTLLERDALPASGPPGSWFDWRRRGIPHFHQPHAFIPRGRALLREVAPDVYSAMLEAGASEVDVGRKVPGAPLPEDADLVYLSVRRPLMEWALWRAVLGETGITVRAGARAVSLVGETGPIPRIVGVRTASGETVEGDLVVDALGRTSPAPAWLAELGARPPEIVSSDAGVIYFSRHFRFRPGRRFPDGKWLFSPRGDLGYAGFNTFPGDNGTFAVVFSIPTWDRDLRGVLKNDAAFLAACRAMPVLAPLTADEFAEPITPVLPMGRLQNTLRVYLHGGEPTATGFFPVGDACCHTTPAFALGLSMSLLHPLAVARALAERSDDPVAQALAYWDAVLPEARERYEFIRSADEARTRAWRGERLDVSRRTRCFPLFMLVAAGATALSDPEIFRRTVRRAAFLDRMAVFDDDRALQERVERLFAAMLESGLPRAGPPRDALLALLGEVEGANPRAGDDAQTRVS